jgi:glycosyltransferase EpsJ
MKSELISIIVPVYNVEKYLERCINSLVNQTYSNLEIILVDDGSTDQSGKMCDTYAERYPNIKVVHKKNAGLGYARNTGLENATGKYVAFVDSDDYVEYNMISNLYNDIIRNDADACIGGFRRVVGDKIDTRANKLKKRFFSTDEIKTYIIPRMLGKKPDGTDYIEMSVWKVLFKMDIIKKFGLRFPSERELISEDIVFDLDYYPKCNLICMSSDNGYYYCDNEGTLTTRYRPDRFALQKKLFLYIEGKVQTLNIADITKNRRMTTFISNTRYCIKLEAKFAKNNGKSVMLENIRTICEDKLTEKIFEEYDHSTVPLKSRIINLMIKRKNVHLLAIIMILREKFHI